ncbi:MAG: TonB-dependent receptor [Gemmatimonadetes bacterium]|nr:TonB-dependent receptor [Gemmatimonadota bacterium]
MTAGFARRLGLVLSLLLPAGLAAQGTGRIVGRIVDADGNIPLGGARIAIVGTPRMAQSAVDGRYSLTNVAIGTVSLRITNIGYAPKTITEVAVTDGGVTTLDITLSAQAVQLTEITVTAAAERGSVSAALDEQRSAVGIVNAISSEQIARSPDGDAAAAVQRVSGATVQDGKYVFVRGLGDRYTQASLNGARIPSPEPEKKVVPLDLFPSSLLEGITTSKTFTPDQPGDFSGALVNIKTKEFSGKRFTAFSITTGANDAITGQSGRFAPSTGRDWLALGGAARRLPSAVSSTDFTQQLPASQANALIGQLRNVWSPTSRTGAPNAGFGMTLGGNLPTGGTGVSYLLSGTYSFSQETRAGSRRALAQVSGAGTAEELDRYDGDLGRNSVLWGGIANLSTTIGSRSKVALNNTYNRTMDNEGRLETGRSENLSQDLQIQRLRYVERNVRSTQLALTHDIGRGQQIEWGVTASGVTRREPDRSEIVYSLPEGGGAPQWFGFSNEAAVRTFADLKENSLEANVNWRLSLGAASVGRSLKVGGLYRTTDRDAVNTSYSLSLARALGAADLALPAEELFDGRFTAGDQQTLRIVPLAAGGSYTASDRLGAGYAMVTWPLSGSLELIGGARVEHSEVEVSSLSSAGEPSLATPSFTDVLPSLAMNLRLSERASVRLSATQTLSRPEYRELSPVLFREVIGADNVKGNPNLTRALIQNYDLRWELYPSRGEILSLGVFAKRFERPIERIYQGTSGTRIITYVNAKSANNYGAEIELRKELAGLSSALKTFSIAANATVMKSTIEIDPTSGSITSASRKMVGQAPYVLNGGLTWTHPTAPASATLLFNRVGARITEAGEQPLPDVVEQSRNVLDLSLRFPLLAGVAARVDARNLLDAPYQILQGDVIRERYRGGRTVSVGFSWKQ